jgi:hypothetical protein
MRSRWKVVGMMVVGLLACGGSSDSPPGPLSKHFDDMYIAAIPLDQKTSMVQTQNDWSIGKMENAKAEADFNDASTQLEIAHNQQKAAKLGVDSAVSNKKAAEASADKNRLNDATRDLHTAEDVAKAAEARVKYIEAYRAYLQRKLRYAQENMYWREAQYESAKAQLGKKNNIAPKGVDYAEFSKQDQERQKRASSAKDRVESEKQHAMSARDNWLKAQETADREAGRSQNLSDPLSPRSSASQ